MGLPQDRSSVDCMQNDRVQAVVVEGCIVRVTTVIALAWFDRVQETSSISSISSHQ